MSQGIELDAGETAKRPIDANRYWKFKDADAYTGSADDLRGIDAAPTEAALRAVGMVCYFSGVGWFVHVVWCSMIAVRHSQGRLLAPWSVHPLYLAMDGTLLVASIAGLVTGYGLRRLRSWSRRSAAVMVAAFFTFIALNLAWSSRKGIVLADLTVDVCACTILVLPMLALLLEGVGPLLTSAYAETVRRTPHIKVRSRFPTEIRWAFWGLILLCILLTPLLPDP
ncbi:hypothetical protein [Paludisphaera rhizosphaerae]|uniref:hypothetical protein n=1 Tax=Paludisphaera rhizosphaerae TaxID=2711216 RepID=UPI0013ED775E|nr:hypothetical protein [Paludisphaera rhizosphaerae]